MSFDLGDELMNLVANKGFKPIQSDISNQEKPKQMSQSERLISLIEQSNIELFYDEKNRAYHTNDTLSLGKHTYILKVLPAGYRVQTDILLNSEGEEIQ